MNQLIMNNKIISHIIIRINPLKIIRKHIAKRAIRTQESPIFKA